ncbi:MAG: beta-galactosidase [Chitinophaga sp.]|uniref:glycoside hydrolase family 35 protein n=1 Tax=Chitinophaga sp. TaxID=1869181 RepID=UPI001B2EA73C|nr:glycoside hydrolase family 35 protein [Chitinophaga sp.]MBO9729427.1 beta-galactosidase [Chitinophaga sp.]
MKKISVVILMLICCFQLKAQHTFQLGDSAFLLDGKPFQMISGEIHYLRVPRESWRDRIRMAKAMGLNTIGTYVFWNMHEPEQGHYEFTGNNDVAAFVKIAQEEGMWVILRPSPYACAEWEFGGYPYWLQNKKGLVVRSKEPQYLNAYHNYIKAVGKQLAGLQINHGGNILMVQIENEYGSYSNDKEYLEINRKMFVDAGFDGLLYTCDPANDVANGHLPGLLPAVNGVDDPVKVKQLVRDNHNGKGPFYIAEWYPAWFDSWGEKHHTVPYENFLDRLDRVLAAGISINMYMFHGGTTRGYMNGANYDDQHPYSPQVSSYDYDAPLDEAGNATPKFMKFREVIAKHLPAGQSLPEVPAKKPVITTPVITFSRSSSLFNTLPAPVKSVDPLTFEDLHQAYGYVLYRTTVGGGQTALLKIKDLRDYGLVFVNGKRVAILDRRLKQDSVTVTLPAGKATLEILVENLGRINFGTYLLKNKKGITEAVLLNGQAIHNWQQFKLPYAQQPAVKAGKVTADAPVLKEGNFVLNTLGDTYLDMTKWGKGVVWINGHHLGRYWQVGPQQTLYVPSGWLKKGSNKITVLEMIKPDVSALQGIDHPILDVQQ